MVQRRSNLLNTQNENTSSEHGHGSTPSAEMGNCSPPPKQSSSVVVALQRDARHRGQARARQISSELVKAASASRQNSQKFLTKSPSKRGQLAHQRSARLGPRGCRTRRSEKPSPPKQNQPTSCSDHGDASTSSCDSASMPTEAPSPAKFSPTKTVDMMDKSKVVSPKTRQNFRAKRAKARDESMQPKEASVESQPVKSVAEPPKPEPSINKISPSKKSPSKSSKGSAKIRKSRHSPNRPKAASSVEFSSVEFSTDFFAERRVDNSDEEHPTAHNTKSTDDTKDDSGSYYQCGPTERLEEPGTTTPDGFNESFQTLGFDGNASAFNIQEPRSSLLGPALFGPLRSFTRT